MDHQEFKQKFVVFTLWLGVVLDGLIAIDMTLVTLTGSDLMSFMELLPVIYYIEDSTLAYRYACGAAAGLMWGWTVLLYWVLRSIDTRIDIALITAVPVVSGLLVNNILAFQLGYLVLFDVLFQVPIQLFILTALVFSYRFVREDPNKFRH